MASRVVLWVTISTGAAVSAWPYWRIRSMETPASPRTAATLASAPGLSVKRHPQVVGRRRDRRGPRRGSASVVAGWPKVGRRMPRAMSHHVAHHGAGGRAFARAGAAQHDLADRVAFEHHHVGAALQLAQRAMSAGTRQGDMRCSSPRPVICATPSSLIR